MALSGSFTGSIKSNHYRLRVDWSATQNIANNTSKITANMYLEQDSDGWSLNIDARPDNVLNIAGTNYTWSSPAVVNGGGVTTKLDTVTSGDIVHNTDGTKTVKLTATFYIRATITYTYYEKITATAEVTLDTIGRATTPKLSSSSLFMGESLTISTPGASSSFTHDIAYQFAGDTWGAIATGVTKSVTWTVPEMSSKIPNATSGVLTIRCITKYNGQTLGTKTVTATLKLPTTAEYYPTITSVAVAEAVSEVAEHFDAYIQSKSKIQALITAAGGKNSSSVTCSTSFAGNVYTGSSWTSAVIAPSGDVDLVVTAKDSRGRTTTTTFVVNVLAYYKPQVTAFEVLRVNADQEEDSEGEYALVNYEYAVPTLNDLNTVQAVVQYRTEDSYIWTDLHRDTELIGSGSVFKAVKFSTDYQYDFRLVITDYFGTQSTAPALLPSGEVIIDILADGSGIGIGTTAKLPGVCDIKMQTRLQGGTRHVSLPEGKDLNDVLTPGRYVGSDIANAGYGNCPFDSGDFDLDVVASGVDGQVKQVITLSDPDWTETFTRFYHYGEWSLWAKPTNLQKLLWSGSDPANSLSAGGSHMNAGQTATLSENISQQNNGIVLAFCLLGTVATDTDIFYYFVPKAAVEDLSGKGHTFLLMTGNFATMARKYLYIYDNKITGDATNTSKGTASGITYDNSKFVLRYVYGV